MKYYLGIGGVLLWFNSVMIPTVSYALTCECCDGTYVYINNDGNRDVCEKACEKHNRACHK